MKFITYKKTKALLFFSILVAANNPVMAACNMNLANGQVGPWDYYDSKNSVSNGESSMGNIKRVTNVHLSNKMLQLTGRATGPIAGDLDYTLRAIPNHPDALNLASRLEKRIKSPFVSKLLKYESMKESADCYFQRALKLAKRAETYEVYAIHLHRNKKYSEAVEQYHEAINLGSKSAGLHYNYGLTLIKLKNYHEAEQQAKIAYKLGYPLPGLRNQLKKQGYCKSNCQ